MSSLKACMAPCPDLSHSSLRSPLSSTFQRQKRYFCLPGFILDLSPNSHPTSSKSRNPIGSTLEIASRDTCLRHHHCQHAGPSHHSLHLTWTPPISSWLTSLTLWPFSLASPSSLSHPQKHVTSLLKTLWVASHCACSKIQNACQPARPWGLARLLQLVSSICLDCPVPSHTCFPSYLFRSCCWQWAPPHSLPHEGQTAL